MPFIIAIIYIIVRLFISSCREANAAAYAREVNKGYKPCYFDEKLYLASLDARYGSISHSKSR